MNVLVIADNDAAINQLPENQVDLLISLGDLAGLSISQAAARCHCRSILAVKGNHDSAMPFTSPIVDLHMKTYEFSGLRFGGFCGSWISFDILSKTCGVRFCKLAMCFSHANFFLAQTKRSVK